MKSTSSSQNDMKSEEIWILSIGWDKDFETSEEERFKGWE